MKKQIIKDALGKTKESFGTNPLDPWSTKANIEESSALDKYLLSRGFNPEFTPKDVKVAHSKTLQFLKWKRDHMYESHVSEEMDSDKDSLSENRKKELSKSARMIKSIYKKHRMVKEDLYDHEKEDKSVKTYGKKPKHDVSDPKDSMVS